MTMCVQNYGGKYLFTFRNTVKLISHTSCSYIFFLLLFSFLSLSLDFSFVFLLPIQLERWPHGDIDTIDDAGALRPYTLR